MKKILIIPAVIGLLAVPSIAMAQHGSDDSTPVRNSQGDNTPQDIRREDRRIDRNQQSTLPANGQNRASDDDTHHSQNVTVPVDSITIDQAKTIALGIFPDKIIKKVETEREHSSLVYSVRFKDSSRADIQASDGAVVRIESKNRDDDSSGRHNSGHYEDSDDRSDDNSSND